MPTKTRKEKIHAQLHRSHSVPPAKSQPVYAYAPEHKHPSPQPADGHELAYVKQDLLRTLMISIIAIVVEVGLYWKFGR